MPLAHAKTIHGGRIFRAGMPPGAPGYGSGMLETPTNRGALAALTAAAVAAGLAAWLADAVSDHARWGVDRTLPVDLHRFRARGLVDAWLVVTQLGSYLAVAVAAALLAAWLWRRRGRPALAAFVVAAVAGEMALGVAVKVAVDRPRPHFWRVETPTLGASFPSAHAMNSLTLVAAVLLTVPMARRRRIVAAVAGLVYVALVGVSRVWLGAHYPSDVLAGWALALAWSLALAAGLARLRLAAGRPAVARSIGSPAARRPRPNR
jgi:membrane-associated phospholipid phosphatase